MFSCFTFPIIAWNFMELLPGKVHIFSNYLSLEILNFSSILRNILPSSNMQNEILFGMYLARREYFIKRWFHIRIIKFLFLHMWSSLQNSYSKTLEAHWMEIRSKNRLENWIGPSANILWNFSVFNEMYFALQRSKLMKFRTLEVY